MVAELEGLAGLPERKLATLRALAQAAAQGALDGERLRAMGGDAAVEELQRLPGVGPFTAQGIVVRGAGEPDYLATAEPRMAHAAALAYGLDAPLAPEELARRGEAWRPYRSWVGVLLRLGLQDASHETRPQFEMHWRGGERGRSRGAALARAQPVARPCRRGDNPSRNESGHQRARWSGDRPGKPAGKCHRNTPPMAEPLQSSAQARLKWCGKSAPASR